MVSFAGDFRRLVDVNFVCAMGPPGGGRNPITPRITRHFNYIAFTELEDDSMRKIFGRIMDFWLCKHFSILSTCIHFILCLLTTKR